MCVESPARCTRRRGAVADRRSSVRVPTRTRLYTDRTETADELCSPTTQPFIIYSYMYDTIRYEMLVERVLKS